MQLTNLKGIGKITADKLALIGIKQVIDLLFHLPLRYQDKTQIIKIRDKKSAELVGMYGLHKIDNQAQYDAFFGKMKDLSKIINILDNLIENFRLMS